MQAQVEVGYFVQEQGAAVGFFQPAHAPRHGPRKGAFFVAKQLAFHQFAGNGGHVHGHQRLAGPARLEVNGLGHQFFARAGFAAHAYRNGGAGRFGNEGMHVLHRRVLAQNGLPRAVARANLLAQAVVFAAQAGLFAHLAHDVPKAVERVFVLHQVVVGPLAQHAHGGVYVFLSRNHNDFGGRQPLPNLPQHLLALAVGQGVIEGDEVGLLSELVEASAGGGKPVHAVVGVLAQAVQQEFAIPLVVLNHKNLEG